MSAFIEARIDRITETGCWLWTGPVSADGYATGAPEGKSVRIHRWLYLKERGDVGSLTLDHLCRVRCCVNPEHLEPVTNKVNVLRGTGYTAANARKTHCKNGHPYDGIGHRRDGTTFRFCNTCKLVWNKADKRQRRAKARAAEKGTT